MKKKNMWYTIVLMLIVIILAIFIGIALKNFTGKSSKQVKASLEFLQELQEFKAIDNNVDFRSEAFHEVKKSSDISDIKYNLIIGDYGVELNDKYTIVGFSNQNTKIRLGNVMSEEDCIKYAKDYLDVIFDEKFYFKEIKDKDKEGVPFYTIAFYRMFNDYICYSSEVLVKIDKYNGSLVGYSNHTNENEKYESENNITKEDCKEIFNVYMRELGINGESIGTPNIGYINSNGEKNELCYILTYRVTDEEGKVKFDNMIINAKDGQVVKYSNTIVEIIPNN